MKVFLASLAALFLIFVTFTVVVVSAQPITVGPSALCHVTDGAFTACPDGSVEWSDVTPVVFPTGSVLYADQADLDPTRRTPTSPVDTLMLMYDETQRTTPLGPDEYVLVHFMTVEDAGGILALEHYVIHIFADGTLIFFEDGVVQGPGRVTEIEGQRAAAGFGPSPNSATPHVIAEFQIELSEAGGASYSPDPLWWSSDVPPPCTATITTPTGVIPSTMNVGQLAEFSVVAVPALPPGATVEYQWTVSGAIIKDYSETTNLLWSTTPMAAADLQGPSISIYWKPDPSQVHPLNAGPVARTVAVTVTEETAAGAVVCSDSETISVERNNVDIAKQAEDFFTSNHGGLVLPQHNTWHMVNSFFSPTYSGSLFFTFHRAFVDRFNSWRAEFGYPAVVPYVGGTPLPTGVEVDHLLRSASPTTPTKPSWFTIAGGVATRPSNGAPCDTVQGQNDLSDFPADLELLGCAVTGPLHNSGHVQIGGDMSSTTNAPRDPIFWRWHEHIDGVRVDRQLSHRTPPIVLYESPFRMFTFVTDLSSVTIVFDEEVTGVAPGDLTVNSIPATQVAGNGAGPYVFTGLSVAQLRLPTKVGIALRAGEIQDRFGNSFGGTSWFHYLLDPGEDDDNDGLSNRDEANRFLTIPFNPDTDGDGMPDGFEARNECLSPVADMEYDTDAMHTDADVDSDGDGVPNLFEFLQGTDPCPPPPRTINPTPGDVDGDGTPDAFDNCPAIPNFDQADADLGGIGNACQLGVVHATAAWLHVQPDGSTVVEPTALEADQEPSFAEQIRRIVQFRVGRDPSLSATELTVQLVDSQVRLGLIASEDRDGLINDILRDLRVIVVPTFAYVAIPILATTALLVLLDRRWRQRKARKD